MLQVAEEAPKPFKRFKSRNSTMKPERSLIWQKRELVGSSGLSAGACRQFKRNIKDPKRGRMFGLDRRGPDGLRLAIWWCPTGPGLHTHRVVNSARLSRSISHGPHCLASNACVNILRNENNSPSLPYSSFVSQPGRVAGYLLAWCY